MEFKICLHNKYREYTIGDRIILVRGEIFSSIWDSEEEIIRALEDSSLNSKDFIQKIDGNFALIEYDNNRLICVVDNVRSIPLFWYREQNTLIVSDDLSKQKTHKKIDVEALRLFMNFGYTLGNTTLLEEVFQIPAGNILFHSKHTTIEEYDRWNDECVAPQLDSIEDESRLNLESIIGKLIEKANGRTIIVPLSGGLDSRFIVSALRYYNYENVVTFTYGLRRSKEVRISERVARELNYPWEFVSYTNKKWRHFLRSDEFKDLMKYCGNYASLPLIQDAMAVKFLKEHKNISGLVVPGISGDFLGGSHISKDLMNWKYNSSHTLNTYYIGRNRLSFDKISFPNSIFNDGVIDKESAILYYENLDYKERQSKYIVNSVRIYEFYGLSWSLPFFYKEATSYWRKLPSNFRYNTQLYRKILFNLDYFPSFDKSDHIQGDDNECNLMRYSKKIYGKVRRILMNSRRLVLDYWLHPMQWYAIFPSYTKYFVKSIRYRKILPNLSLRYVVELNRIYMRYVKEDISRFR